MRRIVIKKKITDDIIEYSHKEVENFENVEKLVGYFELSINRKSKKCKYSYIDYENNIRADKVINLAEIGWILLEALMRGDETGEYIDFEDFIYNVFIQPIYE